MAEPIYQSIESQSSVRVKYKPTQRYSEDGRGFVISLHSDGCEEELTALSLIIHNLNLKDRSMGENTPTVMAIPRFKKGSGSESFWWPLMDNFAELSGSGIKAYDSDSKKFFSSKSTFDISYCIMGRCF